MLKWLCPGRINKAESQITSLLQINYATSNHFPHCPHGINTIRVLPPKSKLTHKIIKSCDYSTYFCSMWGESPTVLNCVNFLPVQQSALFKACFVWKVQHSSWNFGLIRWPFCSAAKVFCCTLVQVVRKKTLNN